VLNVVNRLRDTKMSGNNSFGRFYDNTEEWFKPIFKDFQVPKLVDDTNTTEVSDQKWYDKIVQALISQGISANTFKLGENEGNLTKLVQRFKYS
jgi:hypothetical protein